MQGAPMISVSQMLQLSRGQGCRRAFAAGKGLQTDIGELS
jgi:hypothetical protein